MAFINEVVDKVYVINLDKDRERMESIGNQLKGLGIEYTRFSAIKGANVRRSKYLSDFCETFCTDGMKGCAISHRLIWDDVVANNYKRVLILEDDAVLSSNFNEEFERGWKQVPKDFDLFYLGCHFKCGDSNPVANLVTKVTNGDPKPVDTNILGVGGSWGTHGYIISNKCAKVFQNLTIDTHIDFQMEVWTRQFNLKSYSISPLIVATDNADNKGSNLADNFPPLLGLVTRRIKLSDTVSLETSLTQNHAKFGPFTVNVLVAIIFLVILLAPLWVYPIILGWLLAEFLYSFDYRSSTKFLFFIGAAAGLRYTVLRLLYPFIYRNLKRL